jgi:hypothetical protein
MHSCAQTTFKLVVLETMEGAVKNCTHISEEQYDRAREESCFTTDPNGLEAIVKAHRENAHSAILSWLLGSLELSVPIRTCILRGLVDNSGNEPLPNNILKIQSYVEWNDLDILIEAETEDTLYIIGIEHKIKARESESQLKKYEGFLNVHKKEQEKRIVRKIFLTFVGETPNGGSDWEPVSYKMLLCGLNTALVNLTKQKSQNQYLSDYQILIKRLMSAQRLILKEKDYTRWLFDSKSERNKQGRFQTYVLKCGLRTTLQRAWLAEIINRVKPSSDWTTKTDETHGNGLLEFEKETKDSKLHFGLQMQDWALKVFVKPWPYIAKSNDTERKEAVEDLLDTIRKRFELGEIKLSTGGERGFRSFTLVTKKDSVECRFDIDFWVKHIREKLKTLSKLEVLHLT